jgi:ABC-type Fe3+-hydroxamate transport system substrate-binding protein
MPLYTDQCGRSVSISHSPQRIISLVPSQTELLYDLGLGDRVAGITKFCIHPNEWFRSKTRIGGTKTIKVDIIDQLQPDLIIANKEENVKEQVEELANKYPVWVSDVNNLEDALGMIASIGSLTSTINKAEVLIQMIRKEFNALLKGKAQSLSDGKAPDSELSTPNSACYLIWKDPYITVGGDTFINNMLQYAGFTNVFAHLNRYPEITISQLQTTSPRLLLLSSEPYPFKQKHVDELQQQLTNTKIVLVDGELFSWYGSRLLKSPSYFAELGQRISDS